VAFVPEPVCWAVAPFTLRHLKQRRMRWQYAMFDSLLANRGLMFSRHGGIPGWLAYPFMLIFECFGPVLELAGYGWMLFAFASGIISAQVLLAFLLVAIGLGILLSVSGLLLEEMSFHLYPKKRHLIWLTLALVVENFGYRQLSAVWRVMGMLQRP
jgi:cellulose synthase/poly-beta-1,6-N-acetylglucosamine synthase-like glycosyltransferase